MGPFDVKLRSALASVSQTHQKSDTIVMEVVFLMLERGLLNIPDVGTINVKQARAFLWNAAWLQEYLVGEWREETVTSH